MDDVTREWFGKTFKGAPEELPGHVPQIVANKGCTGLTATCSCGERLTRSRGCNRPGLGYSVLDAFEKYEAHKQQVAAGDLP